MSDLISRSKLIEDLHDSLFYSDSIPIVEEQPAVDAVEVVRCKDCVSFNDRHHTCRSLYLAGQTLVTGYCFNGQRKKV